MTFFAAFIFALFILFSAAVIWGLWWAMRHGQFSNFQEGALSIFDADETIARVTVEAPRSGDVR